MERCDALGRTAIRADDVRSLSDVLIPLLPHPAWRLLLDFLRCDKTFCNKVVPIFHQGGSVTLLLPALDDSKQEESSQR